MTFRHNSRTPVLFFGKKNILSLPVSQIDIRQKRNCTNKARSESLVKYDLIFCCFWCPQILLFAVVAAAAAAPQDKPLVKILSQSFDQDDQGSYQFAYELDNGQKVRRFLAT